MRDPTMATLAPWAEAKQAAIELAQRKAEQARIDEDERQVRERVRLHDELLEVLRRAGVEPDPAGVRWPEDSASPYYELEPDLWVHARLGSRYGLFLSTACEKSGCEGRRPSVEIRSAEDLGFFLLNPAYQYHEHWGEAIEAAREQRQPAAESIVDRLVDVLREFVVEQAYHG